MKSSSLLMVVAVSTATLIASQTSFSAESQKPTTPPEIKTETQSLVSIEESDHKQFESSLSRLMKERELLTKNVRVELEVTSKGKTITSSGVVVSGSAMALGSVEKRKYIKSISYVDGVKTEEIEGTIDLGEQIELRPKILPDGTISATVSFLHTEPSPGSKVLPPLYFQDYGHQSIYQTVTLKSGEPMKIASLSRPGSDKDLILTITATIEP